SSVQMTTSKIFSTSIFKNGKITMIKLRAANEALFTGRRNAAKAAWRAILRELGLQGKVSTVQLAKKWDNLKRRYKDLRFPPVGMETSVDPSSWPWFSLMHDAIEGRLSHSAPMLDPENSPPTPHQSSNQIHIPPNTATTTPAPDFSTETFVTENNVALHREWGILDRERALLERDRQLVEQEKASVQRERAAVQAERMWLERERADLQRDRAMVDQERAALARDREILDQRAIMLNTVGHVKCTAPPCDVMW
uniref:Myb/SANT-like DNA-binding domain-containing protein n=1 Tax=Periophthalmus magnuspinnatus TaxID=409849 RepID=A0A3B4AUF7_9GOBI